MNKEKITQEEINNMLDFLITSKGLSDENKPLNVIERAKTHGIKNYAFTGRAMRNLKFIHQIGIKSKFIITELEPYHARKLIIEMTKLSKLKASKRSTKVKEESVSSTKSNEGFVVESVGSMLFEKAVITLAGYRISGDFSIEKINA